MIQLTNVSKWYQMGEIKVTALDDVSLAIEQGEFVVVLGPSGSGKTTLLNMIGALDTPSGGRVQINGTHVSNSRRSEQFKFRRETVGFIFQTFNLFPSLTALENVQFVRWRAWDWATGCITFRTSYRAASSSGWPSRAPWPKRRRSCWPTSRRASWTFARVCRFYPC